MVPFLLPITDTLLLLRHCREDALAARMAGAESMLVLAGARQMAEHAAKAQAAEILTSTSLRCVLVWVRVWVWVKVRVQVWKWARIRVVQFRVWSKFWVCKLSNILKNLKCL